MEHKTVSEIRIYCRNNNITGYSRYTRKQELVDFVNENIHEQQMNNQQMNNQQMNNQQMNNQHIPNPQIVSDAEFAKALLNSEREFYMKKQYEEIQKQKLHYEKQREEMLKKKKQEDDIKNKIIQETRISQDLEYENALQQDLENNMVVQHIEEIKPKYTEKISGDELEKMRMARLSRFC